jgi:5-formyltetrahydrofolate cyclo-ligase
MKSVLKEAQILLQTKANLRKHYRDLLKSVDFVSQSKKIVRTLTESNYFAEAKNILLFASTDSEVDIWPIINSIDLFKDKTFYIPFVNSLEIGRVKDKSDLVQGPHNIYIPINANSFPFDGMDLAVIPGISFDKAGYRLGHGSGWYDKFLAIHKGQIKHTVGVCFKMQLRPSLPHNEFDIKVDQVISD